MEEEVPLITSSRSPHRVLRTNVTFGAAPTSGCKMRHYRHPTPYRAGFAPKKDKVTPQEEQQMDEAASAEENIMPSSSKLKHASPKKPSNATACSSGASAKTRARKIPEGSPETSDVGDKKRSKTSKV